MRLSENGSTESEHEPAAPWEACFIEWTAPWEERYLDGRIVGVVRLRCFAWLWRSHESSLHSDLILVISAKKNWPDMLTQALKFGGIVL